MKPERIPEILKKFEDNMDRAIMIDGCWGIGKTYQLLAHISGQSRKEKRKKKYVYVSMFGKETIDDIHTELYAKMNPCKHTAKKAIRLIPKVAPLITGGVDLVESLQFALKTEANELPQKSQIACVTNEAAEKAGKIASEIGEFQETVSNKKVKTRRRKKTIVIFDDFERLDFDRIAIETLLGYFHNLMLQEIKIVVACSEKEIYNKFNREEVKKKVYTEFKEKVFDRRYSIMLPNEEIMRSYWGEDSKYLDPEIMKEMKGNLRFSQRAAQFYSEIKQVLEEKTNVWRKTIFESVLVRYSICIIVGTFSDEYKDYYRKLLDEAKDDGEKKENNIEYYSETERYGFQGEISERVGKTMLYVKNRINDFDRRHNNWYMNLFIGLCKLYYHNDETGIMDLIITKEDIDRNPLLEDVSFLSQEEKKSHFIKQEEYIYKTKKFDVFQLKRTMRNMFLYGYMDEQKAQKVAVHIIKNKADNYHWLHDMSTALMRDDIELTMEFAVDGYNEGYQNFIKYLSNMFEKVEYREYLDAVKHAWEQRDYSRVETLLRGPSVFALDNMNTFKPEVINIIKESNYFICNIKETISPVEWNCMRYIRTIAKENNFLQEMEDYIQSIDDKGDLTVKKRKTSLIGK